MPADALQILLRGLCLPGMAARYEEALAAAESGNWGYRQFLLHLCETEAAQRPSSQDRGLAVQPAAQGPDIAGC